MSERVQISVVVPVRNEGAVLAETASMMLAQRGLESAEFIFVDGQSDDESRHILAELAGRDPRVRVLENPERIEPAALNLGIAHASGEFVALLNAHCRFPDDYLSLGIHRLSDGGVTWVTGPAVPVGQTPFGRAVARALVSPLGAGGSRKWRAPEAPWEGEIELDTGLFAGVVRLETLRRLGTFDEAWTVNHDSEMAGRVLDEGGRIVQLSQMGAVYHPRATARGLWDQYWRFGYFRVRTAQRHPVALRPFHIGAAGLVLTPLVACAGPGLLQRAARLALGAYIFGVVRAARAADAPNAPAGTAPIAAALAIMHLGWGAGFLAGVARFGPPVRGLVHVLTATSRGS